MYAIVRLQLRTGLGAVGRLASALDETGLRYERHYVYGGSQGFRRMDVVVSSAEELDAATIESRVKRTQQVAAVINIRLIDLPELDEEPRYDITPEHSLVNQILWDYPHILPLIRQFEENLKRDEYEHGLMKLGVQVGSRLGTGDQTLEEAPDVHEALVSAVLPSLESVAVGSVDGENLRVTKSIMLHQNLDMMYMSIGQPSGCCYLTGVIQGMLNRCRHLPRMCVAETVCRSSGEAYCYFETSRA